MFLRPSPKTYQVKTVYTLYSHNSTGFYYPIHSLALTDYNELIDLNFSFTIINLVCNDSSPLLLVLVHSSPNNFEKRRTIRETWGKNSDSVKVLFMIGSVASSYLQRDLENENDMYNDFVQGSFLDTYRNITYKHVMIFKYVIYHCPQAKYILKTDDDVFVNIPSMENFLTVDLSPFWSQQNVVLHAKETFKNDVHITGTLMEKIHLAHTDIESLVISRKMLRFIVDYSYNISESFLFGPANIDDKEIRALWKFVSTHSVPRSVLRG
ncbi:hypothetical protein NQ317_017658 [Molorchus minor]|uniref:Hexosyltransferase n=1 Tax=Molorchus minor TaxID=1323400 RepID=A0ABQ9JWG1_9CUCU|nr:hypothetical protein NQ317_017658 [Molorchus minor]